MTGECGKGRPLGWLGAVSVPRLRGPDSPEAQVTVDAGSGRGDAGPGDAGGRGEGGCAEGDENGPFSFCHLLSCTDYWPCKCTV